MKASLKDIEMVARVYHEAVRACDPSVHVLPWNELGADEQEQDKEAVLSWLLGQDTPDPLLSALCGVFLKGANATKTSQTTDKPVPSFPPGMRVVGSPNEITPPPLEATVEAHTRPEEGGWVLGPGGKNVWVGPPKEKKIRPATAEELERINQRIAEAQKKNG